MSVSVKHSCQGPEAHNGDHELEVDLADFGENLSSLLVTDEPPLFTFEDVTYTVKGKKKTGPKHILNGVTGSARGGRMLAIMGGSGAGKTTLLDVLSFRMRGKSGLKGSIQLNGARFTWQRFLRCAAYVEQEPVLWSTLTTRETLHYCGELYGYGVPPAQRRKFVEEVMACMGLTSCARTRAGDIIRKGLSGGQKKRLCIAEALIKRPMMLFLDEPTSALDSASAHEVAKYLHNLAKLSHVVVLCTIHQPSHRTFGLFDDTMTLARGRVAYCGPTADVLEHMLSVGAPPLPTGMALAEYIIEVTNSDFTDEEHVNQILDKWKPPPIDAPKSSPTNALFRESHMRSIPVQWLILIRRKALVTFRDPTLYVSRWVFGIVGNLVFASTYSAASDRDQTQVLARVWLLTWAFGAAMFVSVMVVAIYDIERHIVQKEMRNSMYGSLAHLCAQTVIDIPCIIVFAICCWLPCFIIVGYRSEASLTIILALAATFFVAESLAQLLAMCLPHYFIGMAIYIGVMYIGFLLSGVVISIEHVVGWLRWAAYINPWLKCQRASIVMDFTDAIFEGFGDHGELCSPPPAPCYGRDGVDVLDALRVTKSSFGSEHDPATDILWALCFAAVLKVLQVLYLMFHHNR